VKRDELIQLFAQLGRVFGQLGRGEEWEDFNNGLTVEEYDKLIYVVNRQFVYNGWFTKENVQRSLLDWSLLLTEEKLKAWTLPYKFTENQRKVAIIMAGNIPLVGFHDFLSVIMSGHKAITKLSTDDQTLIPAFLDVMVKWQPDFQNYFTISSGRMNEMEAVIATGSNNSMKYFSDYFGKYPHVFRKNRTSISVLTGKETTEELHGLGEDIFTYYGLGCRNVTHLLMPKDYELKTFFEGIFDFKDVIYHKKYGNNYDYNKAIFLMNKHALFDNNFVLLRESEDLFSPLSMIHYHFYESQMEIDAYIEEKKEDIQAVVGHNYTPFGKAQKPALDEYADNMNTLAWLSELN
jgi:hypothetical protein